MHLQVHPKSGVWRYRRTVPNELRGVIGKREILRSLGTRDHAEAKRRSHAVAIEVDKQIEDARLRRPAKSSIWKDWDIDEFAGRCICWISETKRIDPEEITDPAQFESLVREYVETCFSAIEIGSLDYLELRDEILSELEPTRPYVSQPREPDPWPLVDLYSSRLNAKTGEIDKSVTLDRLFELWKIERKPESKLLAEWATVLHRFRQLVADIDVDKIAKDHVRDFKDKLIQMPRVLTTVERKKRMDDIIAATSADTQRISAKTANKALQLLSGLFSWAVKNNRMRANPALGIKAIEPRGKDKRVPYDPADLKMIFSSDLYRCRSWGANQWLPLLGLYTGARLEELGQSFVKDVAQEEGHWFIQISDLGEGQALKTKGSNRKVPLHPKLIQLGFLRYVDRIRKSDGAQLFPELKRDSRGKITQNWSRWWGRYARQLGVEDRRKVFHSFRHGFKDACRRAGIEEAIHDALTGHANGSLGRGYGLGYDLRTLTKAVKKINFPGFPL